MSYGLLRAVSKFWTIICDQGPYKQRIPSGIPSSRCCAVGTPRLKDKRGGQVGRRCHRRRRRGAIRVGEYGESKYLVALWAFYRLISSWAETARTASFSICCTPNWPISEQAFSARELRCAPLCCHLSALTCRREVRWQRQQPPVPFVV